jgi:hypothetical protein
VAIKTSCGGHGRHRRAHRNDQPMR